MPTLEFKGKSHIYAHHLAVPHRPLIRDDARSVGPGGTDDNLIVHGDNLDALKALLPRYAGRVKCVYIDPPYNTGNEGWRYNDNVNGARMIDWIARNGAVDGDDMERHDKWLCMMWPRLCLLKDLLADDGAIFVSIDDNEVHHLRMIMDEIFGETNFIGSFVWEGTGKNNAHFISVGHDYILCYAHRLESLTTNNKRWRVLKEGVDEIQKIARRFREENDGDLDAASNALKDWYASLDKTHVCWAHRHYSWIDARGVYFAGDISAPHGGGPRYEVLHPITRQPVNVPAGGWRFSQLDKMQELIADNRVHFGPDESRVPNIKRYLHETDSQVLTSVFYRDRRAAHQELVRMLPDSPFEYPKDVRVLSRILEAVTSDGDVVLDSFAGSGATAHAVLALNEEDGGDRRFILVECEDYADTITAERVRRVIAGHPDARDPAVRTGLGGSFAYCTLGPPIEVETLLTGDALPPWPQLAAYLIYTASGISTGRTPLTPLNDDGLFYRHGATDYYLLYKPDAEYLRGADAVLDLTRARRIGAVNLADERKAVVFAPACYAVPSMLSPLRVVFSQLPSELYQAG